MGVVFDITSIIENKGGVERIGIAKSGNDQQDKTKENMIMDVSFHVFTQFTVNSEFRRQNSEFRSQETE